MGTPTGGDVTAQNSSKWCSFSCFNRETPLLNEKEKARAEMGVKVIALALSVIVLTGAVIAALLQFGMLPQSFPLAMLAQVGQFGAGALVTGSAISAIFFTVLSIKQCREPNSDELPLEGSVHGSQLGKSQLQGSRAQGKSGGCNAL